MKIKTEIMAKGDFDLSLTIKSGQTSQPAWLQENGYFNEVIKLDGQPCIIRIKQKSNDVEAPVEIIAESQKEISEEAVNDRIINIFDLNNDINNLYEYLKSDPKLEPTISFCRGLRLFKAHDPFECIISSISSANCSIIRWNKAINDIKQIWGDNYKFNSENYYLFPPAEILSSVPEHEFEEMQRHEDDLSEDFIFSKNLKSCGVGYRAKYIINSAKMLQNKVHIENFDKMSYENAYHSLLELPGVGPKVADCILFYGFGFREAFPVDVWIGRIVSELYFNGEEIKPSKARLFGMERFGDYAGYVQLYLFHYARKSGLLELIKNKK